MSKYKIPAGYEEVHGFVSSVEGRQTPGYKSMVAYLDGRRSDMTVECLAGEGGFIRKVASGFLADPSRVDMLQGHVTVIKGAYPYPDELEAAQDGVTVYRPGLATDKQWDAATRMIKNFVDADLSHYNMPYDCPFCGVKAGG